MTSVTVPRWLDRGAAWAWRLLLIGAVAGAAIWLLARLWLVLVPVVIAVLLARILIRAVELLHARGVPRGLAAGATVLLFLAALGGVSTLVGIAVADEFHDVGPTVTEAVDDIEDWIVEDGPFDLDRATVERVRGDVGDAIDEALRGSGSDFVASAVLAAEVLIGVFIGIVMAFYMLKDSDRFVAWVRRRLPARRRELVARAAGRAWATFGGFLRGAAFLGVIEAVVIALAVLITGGSLVVPVAVLTFLAAFIPFVGAVLAGVVAVLVTLTTAGPEAAVIVAIVVVLLQQFDNEIFAPLVYGHALRLHPIVILLSVVVGGAALGALGSVVAVPVVAIAVNVMDELHPGAELTTSVDE